MSSHTLELVTVGLFDSRYAFHDIVVLTCCRGFVRASTSGYHFNEDTLCHTTYGPLDRVRRSFYLPHNFRVMVRMNDNNK